ncbi:Faim2 [Symbiodinium necroappetens]|uniref:Faim2 protein n=1 Tax=Symbiodinium necroappetens TaxID=1628268 RepID=A0A812JLS4_9DINO|nr:Faim2 [Symbiodinium necroappetens]
MLSALADRPALAGLLPYAALFYGSPSTYIFYDAEGHAHDVQQGEGGEQGDPLMPSLFALGQHMPTSSAARDQSSTSPVEHYLCVHMRSSTRYHPVGQFAIVREALARHANIQVHLGKTRAWNSVGEEPPGLLEVLPPRGPENPCWTGNWALPAAEQGVHMVVLGSPVGSRDFIAAKLAQRLQHPEL